jgi:hypothetical protein
MSKMIGMKMNTNCKIFTHCVKIFVNRVQRVMICVNHVQRVMISVVDASCVYI